MDQVVQRPDPAPASPGRGGQTGNFLLQAIEPGDFALVAPHLERSPFTAGEVIANAGDPIASVWFPEAGVAAILDSLDGERHYALGMVGLEGFAGWPLLLGEDRWPHLAVMRAEDGEALRLPAPALLEAVAASPRLGQTLLRFAANFMTQMSRTIVSSLAHPIERRMARWILLYHDRVRGDEICMTHEEFRIMLGVRRSSVTDALHRLEEEGAVRAVRGRVIVRDRAVLLRLAGETYGQAERQYRRLIIGQGGCSPSQDATGLPISPSNRRT